MLQNLPDPATPTVAAPAPMNLAAESMSRDVVPVWNERIDGNQPTEGVVPRPAGGCLSIAMILQIGRMCTLAPLMACKVCKEREKHNIAKRAYDWNSSMYSCYLPTSVQSDSRELPSRYTWWCCFWGWSFQATDWAKAKMYKNHFEFWGKVYNPYLSWTEFQKAVLCNRQLLLIELRKEWFLSFSPQGTAICVGCQNSPKWKTRTHQAAGQHIDHLKWQLIPFA